MSEPGRGPRDTTTLEAAVRAAARELGLLRMATLAVLAGAIAFAAWAA